MSDKEKNGDVIQVESGKSHVMDVGSGKIAGELIAGIIDGDGKLHDNFICREMTGEEEDLLSGSGPPMARLNKVISNCTESIGSIAARSGIVKAVEDLTSADRMVMLIALRRVSLGDFYDVKVDCTNRDCNNKLNASLDLSKLEIAKMKDPCKRDYEVKLSDGDVLRWHMMTAADEAWLVKERKRDDEKLLTISMVARVDSVGDYVFDKVKDPIKSMKKMKSFSLSKRREIRKHIYSTENHIDTSVEFECPKCGHEWKEELNVATLGFFFPSEE